ncbi:hypothetical protein Spa11_12160 [Botrimarina mediterranea]|uniref:Uncharacterized protein n=1 Tax=Botrimarina mediterranea TaxID=2528022 RepID=A0A518K5F8_9BACT|nr:hypothetical protein Spa11_12160 [Botrimarina mediterranea]
MPPGKHGVFRGALCEPHRGVACAFLLGVDEDVEEPKKSRPRALLSLLDACPEVSPPPNPTETPEPGARALGGKRVPGGHRGLAPTAQTLSFLRWVRRETTTSVANPSGIVTKPGWLNGIGASAAGRP